MIDDIGGIERPQKPNERNETPSSGGELVSGEDVESMVAMYQRLKEYNKQFSFGRVVASLIESAVRTEDSSLGDERPFTHYENNRELSLIPYFYEYREILEKTGLTFKPKYGEKDEPVEKIGADSLKILELKIEDQDRFMSFLGNLRQDQVAKTDLKYVLEHLSDRLSNQLLEGFGFSSPNDNDYKLFNNFPRIMDDYKRLGLGFLVEKTERYWSHIKQGNIREYAEIEAAGLFKGPNDSWGPAKWQTDATPEILWRDWGTALEVLKNCRLNPKATKLYKELLNNLINCANVASQNIPHNLSADVKSKFNEIFSGVKSQLAEMN